MDNREKLLKKTKKMVNEVKLYLSNSKHKDIDYQFLVKKYNNIKLNYYLIKNNI
jgi:hypothetical protein